MSHPNPLISIITPCLNGARYLEDTIRSVQAQAGAQWEHIIIDGGSTDESVEILRRYPHVRWSSEPDRGPAAAMNRGLRLARGARIGWLNVGDTLLPGALATVSRALDRDRNRFAVVGRCELADERGHPTGIYHPRQCGGHRRLIEIWSGPALPRPAVFFDTQLLIDCGLLDEDLPLGFDYELFLRFSRDYWFFCLDDVLAMSRVHPWSRSLEVSEEDRRRQLLAISRRYWGSPIHPRYWMYSWSSRRTVAPLRHWANTRWNQALGAASRERTGEAASLFFLSAVAFPPLVWRRGIYPAIRLIRRLLGPARWRELARWLEPPPSTP